MRLPYSLVLLIGLAMGLGSRSASAQVTAPSQGGAVSAIDVTATTMELKFGTGGTGQGRVIAIAATGGDISVPLAAVNGNFYNAAPTYGNGTPLGQGFVVYSGPGRSVKVTGLQPNTRYYVTNAEYNTDSTTIVYNTRGSNVSLVTNKTVGNTTPLPVELTSFTGTVDARSNATLRWATASERNTAYFALERSADGTSFTEAGQVAAAGGSSQQRTYQWLDPQCLTHLTYYRLRQVDLDGTVYYSEVVALTPVPSLTQLIEVYPNPSAGQPVQLLLQGYSGESIKLWLVDTLGRPVLTQLLTPADAQSTVPLALPQGLAPGTYVLTLVGSGSPVQKRIIVSD